MNTYSVTLTLHYCQGNALLTSRHMNYIKTYPFITGFFASVIIAIMLYATGILHVLTQSLGSFEYIGSVFAGMAYAFTFTTAAAAFLFVELGETSGAFTAILFGGIGAMIGDLFFYWLLNNGVKKEVKAFFVAMVPIRRLKRMEQFTKRRIFAWTIPFLASLLIASPLPDELGITLFSLINFKPKYLAAVSFLLNTGGIAALVFLGRVIGG